MSFTRVNLGGNIGIPLAVSEQAIIEETSEVERMSFALPEAPLLTIAPTRGWVGLNLKDVWAHRELLYFLTWRDIKIRYKQTALGALWAIIQPLFPMLIFTLFFGRLAKMPSDGIPYSVFAYAGLLPWTYFASAVNNSANSIVGSSNLITKVYFPRMIIPAAAVLAALVDFAIAFLLLAVLMVYHHVAVTASVFLLLPLIAMLTVLSLGIGLLFSGWTVKYRDIRFALPFLVQVWMFATPVIYPASLVPQQWRWVLALNPVTGIVEGFRAALFGRPLPWDFLAYSGLFTLVILVYAAYSFRRLERIFADLI
ncbi:MAG TPA: ABC transporter permease [Terriglobales bacterium]|nr:ABC transporter permease [Terriglobales bacterium]